MNERSEKLGLRYRDLAVLDQLVKHGADLSQPRHVVYYSYVLGSEAARAMQAEAGARGLAAGVREPLPDAPGRWGVICETDAITSLDFVREADDFFEELADRYSAEYDGWEAAV